MKKILIIFIFLTSMFYANAANIFVQRNCSHEATVAYDAVYALTGNMILASNAADNAYDSCMDEGGNSGGPVGPVDEGLQP